VKAHFGGPFLLPVTAEVEWSTTAEPVCCILAPLRAPRGLRCSWGLFLSPLWGFAFVHKATHGWRRGLQSVAASRLSHLRATRRDRSLGPESRTALFAATWSIPRDLSPLACK
jgi:hypothetical protein